jgi:hypothetical protein
MWGDPYTDDDWARSIELISQTTSLAGEEGLIEERFLVCAYCMSALPTKVDEGLRNGFHVEHIVPKSRGGSNHPDNIAISCSACNLRKRARTPAEWYVSERSASGQRVENDFPGLVLMALRETYDNIGGLPARRDPSRKSAADGPNPNALRELDPLLPPAGRISRLDAVTRFLEGELI